MTPSKPSYKRGDVVLVLYSNFDLRTAQTLPALIVQADNLQTGLSQVIVAMITSCLFRAHHPSRVVVTVATPAGQQSGLLTHSVVITDSLATVVEVAIDRLIDTLPMTDIDAAGATYVQRKGVSREGDTSERLHPGDIPTPQPPCLEACPLAVLPSPVL